MKVGREKVESDRLSKRVTCGGDTFPLCRLWQYEDVLRDSAHTPKPGACNK